MKTFGKDFGFVIRVVKNVHEIINFMKYFAKILKIFAKEIGKS